MSNFFLKASLKQIIAGFAAFMCKQVSLLINIKQAELMDDGSSLFGLNRFQRHKVWILLTNVMSRTTGSLTQSEYCIALSMC